MGVSLVERCPRCAYPFDREEGYWVGALITNTGATQVAFFAWFLGGLALTWPDVPWNVLLHPLANAERAARARPPDLPARD